jgi:sugar fermentation stimulation protein A
MRFPFTCIPATFLDRPNRFLVIARLGDGRTTRVHCPDPGRLRELLAPGARVYVSEAARAHGSTTHDLRFVEHPEHGTLISLDSRLPNALFREWLEDRALAPFADWIRCEREVTLPVSSGPVRSRVDFVIYGADGNRTWVEVKSAALVEGRTAYFPDAVTERGRRHVLELTHIAKRGDRAAVCFVVQRPDAVCQRPQWDRDPAFAEALDDAERNGVALYAWTVTVSVTEATLGQRIPVITRRPSAQ